MSSSSASQLSNRNWNKSFELQNVSNKQRNEDFVFLVHENIAESQNKNTFQLNRNIVLKYLIWMSIDTTPWVTVCHFSFLFIPQLTLCAIRLAYLLLTIDVSNECMCVSAAVDVDVLSFLICTRDRMPRAYIIYSLIEVTILSLKLKHRYTLTPYYISNAQYS